MRDRPAAKVCSRFQTRELVTRGKTYGITEMGEFLGKTAECRVLADGKRRLAHSRDDKERGNVDNNCEKGT